MRDKRDLEDMMNAGTRNTGLKNEFSSGGSIEASTKIASPVLYANDILCGIINIKDAKKYVQSSCRLINFVNEIESLQIHELEKLCRMYMVMVIHVLTLLMRWFDRLCGNNSLFGRWIRNRRKTMFAKLLSKHSNNFY
jgi:hypothetical protein